jgi:hypothetical protein
MSDTTFDTLAQNLGLNDPDTDPTSSYAWHLEGDDLAAAMVDRFERQRQWYQANGLLRGWKLKLAYYFSEYRSSPDVPHLNLMQQWGAQGEYSAISLNYLRGILKTLLGSVIQNPPTFTPKATNADADSMESASLYKAVLDYYIRDMRLNAKIASAVERGLVTDSGYCLIEWNPFAVDGDAPPNSGIWKGAPSVKVLNQWDVAYDLCKSSFEDLSWILVRDWVDRASLAAQFPEFADDIDSCQSRAALTQSTSVLEPNRYYLNSYPEMSNEVQVFKLFHRAEPYMPNGRFCMALENGKLIFENPSGLIYPKLPVERFVPDEQLDVLLGYSPINELIAVQEALNTIESAIVTNANNYANQYVACQTGTEITPRTLADGQKILEYPPGSAAPVGLNLTAIPNTLFEHVKALEDFMMTIPGVSNSSRGQTGGANQSGSAMLFLQGQTTANQGNMSQNYQDFAAAVMTSLLHVLRVFGRTERTINIMGKTVASRTIVLADALTDFDQVTVEMSNPVMNTPAGRMQFASEMLQFGNATPAEALVVATSGNLGPVEDPARELEYEMALENQWLLNNENVLVNALDNHEAHIQYHTRLFSTPWLRKPDLAQKLGIDQAPAIQQTIMGHIQQHMQMLGGNQVATAGQNAGVQPGQPSSAPSPAMGHAPPMPSGAAPVNSPAQANAVNSGSHLPLPPQPPRVQH